MWLALNIIHDLWDSTDPLTNGRNGKFASGVYLILVCCRRVLHLVERDNWFSRWVHPALAISSFAWSLNEWPFAKIMNYFHICVPLSVISPLRTSKDPLHPSPPPWMPFAFLCFTLVSSQGAHTIGLCSRLLFYSKCTGFTVCFTYSDISLTMYINQW